MTVHCLHSILLLTTTPAFLLAVWLFSFVTEPFYQQVSLPLARWVKDFLNIFCLILFTVAYILSIGENVFLLIQTFDFVFF